MFEKLFQTVQYSVSEGNGPFPLLRRVHERLFCLHLMACMRLQRSSRLRRWGGGGGYQRLVTLLDFQTRASLLMCLQGAQGGGERVLGVGCRRERRSAVVGSEAWSEGSGRNLFRWLLLVFAGLVAPPDLALHHSCTHIVLGQTLACNGNAPDAAAASGGVTIGVFFGQLFDALQ